MSNANVGRIETDRAQLAEFDDARGRRIFDQIGDVKNPDLIEAKVRDEVDAVINEVGERLFTDPTSGVTLGPNEKVSDAIFRVLQDKDTIKQIDEAALAGALNEAGVNPEQFAQIYRTTVRESAQQLNALSQLAKKLRGAGSMDMAAYTRVKDYFDERKQDSIPSKLPMTVFAIQTVTDAHFLSHRFPRLFVTYLRQASVALSTLAQTSLMRLVSICS